MPYTYCAHRFVPSQMNMATGFEFILSATLIKFLLIFELLLFWVIVLRVRAKVVQYYKILDISPGVSIHAQAFLGGLIFGAFVVSRVAACASTRARGHAVMRARGNAVPVEEVQLQ